MTYQEKSEALQKMVEIVAAHRPGWQVEGYGDDRCDNLVVAIDVNGDWTREGYDADDCEALAASV